MKNSAAAWLGWASTVMASAEPLSVTTTYEAHCKFFLILSSRYKREPWPEEKLERTPGNPNRRQSLGLPGLDSSSLSEGFTDISRAEALPVEGKRLDETIDQNNSNFPLL